MKNIEALSLTFGKSSLLRLPYICIKEFKIKVKCIENDEENWSSAAISIQWAIKNLFEILFPDLIQQTVKI